MSNIQVQLRRGTTAQHGSFTGAQGELTVDTDKNALVLHDGATAGGTGVSNAEVKPTGLTQFRSLADRFADSVNVLDYIPSDKHAGIKAGTNTDDLSSYFESAIETSKRVFVPKGTYHLNANINSKTILEGEGTASTFLKPYNESGAVFVYTFTAQQTPVYDFWDYHSEVSNICFTYKTTAKVGIGFAFGKTTVSAYTSNDEYANNVKFKGCFFKGLEKGVMFTFGNIGTEFYSCGFSSNKYGAYMLDGKGTGSLMHAGNKHFFGGEFSTNECAVYIHNTTDGFGEVTFNSTIFEYNRMACYIYNNQRTYAPLSWSGCWFEKNGTMETTSGQTQITIDSWTGTTRSDQTINHRTIQLEGLSSQLVFDKTGIFTDCKVDGNYHTVVATNCRVETEVGVGGADFEVVSDKSKIEIHNPITSGGIERADGVIVTGVPTIMSEGAEIDNNAGRGKARDFRIVARGSKISNYGASLETSIPFETQVDTGSGSFNLTGSVVSDGLIYASCNEYTRTAFLSTQYTRVNGSPITTTAGFYVYTFDFKRTLGNPKVHLWNRGTVQFSTTITAPSLNRWYTFGGIGYSPGSQSFYLDFSGDGTDCTWRMSAYQLHRFDSMVEAHSFLESKVYASS